MSTEAAIPPLEELTRQLDEAKKQVASQTSKKRERAESEDGSRKRKQPTQETKKKKKKQKQKQRKKVLPKDDLYIVDESNLEMPTDLDFRQPWGPQTSNYVFKPQDTAPVIPSSPEKQLVAPEPMIPAADDDSTRVVNCPVVPKRQPAHPRRLVEGTMTERPKMDNPRARDERPLPTILRIPTEVREEIYRHLLISPMPIPVRAGWTRIYERERPCLHAAIISTCKKISSEATKVLYRENTFLYRLRDPTNGIADIERLAEDDDKSEYDTDDDGAEFGARSGRRRPRRAVQEEKGVINIPKYGALFRHLIVEAEHNRYSKETQQHMAKAIRVFTAQEAEPGENEKAFKTKGVPKATNIHTLTVRVAPMRNEGSFTFVDFFDLRSPVLDAMTALSCQFIRIELLGRYLNRELRDYRVRMFVDMRYRRIARRVGRGVDATLRDMWRNDPLILETRARKVSESRRALVTLKDSIRKWCDKHAERETLLEDWLADEFGHDVWEDLFDEVSDVE